MLVIERVLGDRFDPSFARRLHDLEHGGGLDVLRLPTADMARRRLRARSEAGQDVAIALPRDQPLFDGAVLLLEADHALLVRAEAERWLRLEASAPETALQLGYHAGNLHWRVRFDGPALLIALEGPAEDYLARLGDLASAEWVSAAVLEAPLCLRC